MSRLFRVVPAIIFAACSPLVHATSVSTRVLAGGATTDLIVLIGIGLLGFVINRRR